MKSACVSISLLCSFLMFTFIADAVAAPVAADLDNSGGVDAIDVQLVINGALGLDVTGNPDVDYSSSTTAVDVQFVINAALGIDIDPDSDGLCDAAEANLGTNAGLEDTDGDGVSDGQEMLDGTDPLLDERQPDNVEGFAATAGDGQVVLSWALPDGSSIAGVRIQRDAQEYPASPDSGDTVYDGTSESFIDTGVQNGTLYYYVAFSYSSSNVYATGVQAFATPTIAGADAGVLGEFGVLGEVLGALTDNDLDADDRKALGDSLDDAESAYRHGDPCGSSSALKEFMALAQGCRAGAVEGTAEELYNLGRMIRYDMTVLDVPCEGDERVGVTADATCDKETSDNTGLAAEVVFGEPRVLTVGAEGEVYTHVQVPGAGADMEEPGEPGVPVLRWLMAVPTGADITVTYETAAAETVYTNLFPSQPQPVDRDEEPIDPSVFETPPFMKKDNLYQTDTFYPAEPVRVTELGDCRDLRMVMVEVAAGQYNAVTDELVLFDHVDLDVTFSINGKAEPGFVTEATLSPFESNPGLYTGAVLNSEAVLDHVTPVSGLPTIAGEELLILTHPDFRNAARDLAEWKNSKGIVTRVFDVADGSGAGPDTREEIDDFIAGRYDEAFIRPSYVLLMGDAEFIPVFYVDSNHYEDEQIGTDWQYSIYGELGEDLLPDFGVGRICVDTLPEAEIVVNKIIDYERAPPYSTTFYNTASFAAQFECCRWGAEPCTAARTFTEVSEFARDVMTDLGYTVERIYEETGTQVPTRYYDGTLLPDDLGPDSGFAWDGSTRDIINAFNDGRFLIMHRDHGWSSSWSHPIFATWYVDNELSNGDFLPVVFSVNCASGWFDHETSSPSSTVECIVEHLLLKDGGGAVGILGDSRNSPSWANSSLTEGFFDAIWPDAVPEFGDWRSKHRLGDILNHGKMYLLTQITVTGSGYGDEVSAGAAHDELHLWHVIGDPTLEIWTEQPDRSALPASAVAEIDMSTLRVTYPADGALVTAFQRDEDSEPVAVGRGEVVSGVAILELIEELDEDEDVELSVSMEHAVSASMVLDIWPPEDVLLFEARGRDEHVVLSWTNPSTADFEGVRIQRSTIGFPTGPEVGDTVYDGTDEYFEDTGLINSQTYYYTAFAYDEVPNYASGLPASATPHPLVAPSDVTEFEATAGAEEIVLSWVNPADVDFIGVRIQRDTAGYPGSPEAGTTVYEGEDTTFTDTGLTNDTVYYYTAYAQNEDLLYSAGVNDSAAPNDLSPPGRVVDFAADDGEGYVTLTWANPTDDDFAGVRIQRDTVDYPASPEEGTNVYDGPEETHTDTDVVDDTEYMYSAFAYDHDHNFSARQTDSAMSRDMTPPGPVTDLIATPGEAQVMLSWTNPTDPDFEWISIVRNDTRCPESPTDGIGLDRVTGADKYTDDFRLRNGTTYYYAVYARDGYDNPSVAVCVSATPEDTVAPAEVTDLYASPSGMDDIYLSWTNPATRDFDGVRIQRGMKGYPSSPTEGTNVYDGRNKWYIDTTVILNQTYYYTVFTYDEVPNYSAGVQIMSP